VASITAHIVHLTEKLIMLKRSTANMLWLAGWLATLAVTFWLLWAVRQNVIAELSRPEAQADWQRWKEDETARQQRDDAPVRRRAPKSDEPPALVLMRDSFPAIAGVALSVVTICYGFVMLAFRSPVVTSDAADQP
jgi:flagellar biosynthesis/type III secretory pathway M-ring protein FliF/YscJ